MRIKENIFTLTKLYSKQLEKFLEKSNVGNYGPVLIIVFENCFLIFVLQKPVWKPKMFLMFLI